MRVLIVVPPSSLEPPLTRPRHAPHYAAIVAAALLRAGHDVALQDQTLNTVELPRVVADARAARAELLLLVHSDYNREFEPSVLGAVSAALAVLPVPVWGVGRLAQGPAEAALRAMPGLDGLLFGEPEFAAVQLADALQRGAPTDVPGSMRWVRAPGTGAEPSGQSITVREPGNVDLDDSPVPAWHLVATDRYGFSPHQSSGAPVFPVLASRGCPFPCFYCEVRNRPAWSTRSVDAVLHELRELNQRWGATSFFIADPTFGIDRSWALEFCRRLPAEGPAGIRWSCMCRTDRCDAELFAAMKAAGCWNVLFGIESFHAEPLRQARKNLDPSTIGPAIAAAKAAGLEVIASLMVGLPGDSPAGVRASVQRLVELEPDFAQFFVVQLAPDEAPRDGRLLSGFDGSRFEFWGHVWAPHSFGSAAELKALRRWAFARFYLRPRFVARRLAALVRAESPVDEVRRAVAGGLLAVRLAAGSRPD